MPLNRYGNEAPLQGTFIVQYCLLVLYRIPANPLTHADPTPHVVESGGIGSFFFSLALEKCCDVYSRRRLPWRDNASRRGVGNSRNAIP
jgi:hypothetical protein